MQLFQTGFDPFATVADILVWPGVSTVNAGTAIVLAAGTSSGIGQAFQLNATNPSFVVTWGSNEAIIFGSIRFKNNTVGNAAAHMNMRFGDTTNFQCTIRFQMDGTVIFTSGDYNGTVLASSAAAQFSAGTWDSYQFKVVISNTAGSMEVRKNGSSATLLAVATANTRAGSTNNYANAISFYCDTASAAQIDDFFLNNATGAAPTTWPGDVRVVARTVASSVQQQFAGTPTPVTVTETATTSTATARAAGLIIWTPFTATATGPVSSYAWNFALAFTGNARFALYSDNGSNTAANLIANTMATLANPVAGVNTIAVAGGATLIKGTQYWLAIQTDTAFSYAGAAVNTVPQGSTQTVAYASGMPSAWAGAAVNVPVPNSSISVSPQNWFQVSDSPEDQDSTYISSSTVGQEDIFGIQALPTTPSAILGQQLFVMNRKTDSGARSAALSCSANGSGDIVQNGSIAPSLSYVYGTAPFQATDPTGAAWTLANINGQQIGLKVAT